MSLRIYNGWKLPDGMGLDQLFHASKRLVPLMQSAADQELERRIVALAANQIDRWFAASQGWVDVPCDLDDQQSPLGHAHAKICDRRDLVRQKGVNAPDVDISVSLLAMLHPTGTYALLSAPNQAMREKIVLELGCSPFDYYDDEAPDGITEDEWKARRAVWTSMLGDHYHSSLAGPTFEIVHENHLTPHIGCDRALRTEHVPAHERRVWSLAVETPQSGLNQINGSGVMALIERLQTNPPEAFVSIRKTIHDALPDPIPSGWFTMKKPELLALWQAMRLERETKMGRGARQSPRL